jgi:hypothetical protein
MRNSQKNSSASTIGIPRNFEIAFKKVFAGLLRQKYGVRQVPFQQWELSLPFDIDEAFGKQCGLIMCLIREIIESLKRFIRTQTNLSDSALKSLKESHGNKPDRLSQAKYNLVVKPSADSRQNGKEDAYIKLCTANCKSPKDDIGLSHLDLGSEISQRRNINLGTANCNSTKKDINVVRVDRGSETSQNGKKEASTPDKSNHDDVIVISESEESV